MKARRHWWWLAAGLVALLLAVSGALVLETQSGLRWAFARLADSLPGHLTATDLEGTLLGPIHVHGLRYANHGTVVELGTATLEWRPLGLLAGRLVVTDFSGARLQVHWANGPHRAPSAKLPELALPLAVTVRKATLRNIAFGGQGKTPTRLEEVSLRLRIRGSRFSVDRLQLQAPTVTLTAHGTLSSRASYPFDLRTTWQWRRSGITLAGAGRAWGDLGQWQLQQQLRVPLAARLHLTVRDTLAALRWQGQLHVDRFAADVLQPSLKGVSLAAEIEGSGQGRGGHLHGQLQADGRYGRWRGELQAAGSGADWQLQRLALTGPDQQRRLLTQGTVHLAGLRSRFQLQGGWQKLAWPLSAPAAVRSDQGRFSLRGDLQHYRLRLAMDVTGRQVPAGHWTLAANGTPEGLTVSALQGHVLDGSVHGVGRLSWSPRIRWQGSFRARAIDPAERWPDWPGRLRLSAASQGEFHAGTWSGALVVSRLDGTLRGRPVNGRLKLQRTAGRYRLPLLELHSGSADVRVKGELAQDWQLHWDVHAPTLADLFPGWKGMLRSTGAITGTAKAPAVEGRIEAVDVRAGNVELGRLDARWHLDLADRTTSQLNLDGRQLRVGSRSIARLSLVGEGRLKNHDLVLDVRDNGDLLALKVHGGLSRGVWSARVIRLQMGAPAVGRWTLRQPATIQVVRDQATLQPLCIADGQAHLCAAAHWQAAGRRWRVDLNTEHFPLRLLQPLLPGDAALTGQLDGRVNVAAQGTVPSSLEAHLSGHGELRLRTDAPQPVALKMDAATVTVARAGPRLAGKLTTRLAEGGQLNGQLSAPWAAVQRQGLWRAPVQGRIHAVLPELAELAALVPNLQQLRGRLRADLTVAGSLDHPVLGGSGRLQQGQATISRLGLALKDVNVTVAAAGASTLSVRGGLASGPGTLTVTGTVHLPPTSAWNAELALRGQRVQVANTRQARVLASPDLKLVVHPGRIELSGQLTVPEAHLAPIAASEAVRPSPDVVVTGAGAPTPQPRWQVVSDVQLRLGEQVHFTGYGFKGRIGGALRLRDQPGKVTTARGDLRVMDGTYQAYRQDLTVQHGLLSFTGGPVDNPGLELSAVRVVGDVTAGVRVRGTAQDPVLSLFSTPSMADSDILSYLMLGRPMTQVSQSQGKQLMSAASSSAGLVGGDVLAGWIGKQLGISDVHVQREQQTQQPQLVLGTYLSPRLYVSYGLGLFDNANTVRLRYKIGRKWTLQGETGSQSGGDILYTIERR